MFKKFCNLIKQTAVDYANSIASTVSNCAVYVVKKPAQFFRSVGSACASIMSTFPSALMAKRTVDSIHRVFSVVIYSYLGWGVLANELFVTSSLAFGSVFKVVGKLFSSWGTAGKFLFNLLTFHMFSRMNTFNIETQNFNREKRWLYLLESLLLLGFNFCFLFTPLTTVYVVSRVMGMDMLGIIFSALAYLMMVIVNCNIGNRVVNHLIDRLIMWFDKNDVKIKRGEFLEKIVMIQEVLPSLNLGKINKIKALNLESREDILNLFHEIVGDDLLQHASQTSTCKEMAKSVGICLLSILYLLPDEVAAAYACSEILGIPISLLLGTILATVGDVPLYGSSVADLFQKFSFKGFIGSMIGSVGLFAYRWGLVTNNPALTEFIDGNLHNPLGRKIIKKMVLCSQIPVSISLTGFSLRGAIEAFNTSKQDDPLSSAQKIIHLLRRKISRMPEEQFEKTFITDSIGYVEPEILSERPIQANAGDSVVSSEEGPIVGDEHDSLKEETVRLLHRSKSVSSYGAV